MVGVQRDSDEQGMYQLLGEMEEKIRNLFFSSFFDILFKIAFYIFIHLQKYLSRKTFTYWYYRPFSTHVGHLALMWMIWEWQIMFFNSSDERFRSILQSVIFIYT